MGGIETDIAGAPIVPGIWAAGEAACVSLHGANRLGSNSTAECLVWGAIAGAEMARGLDTLPQPRPLSTSQLSEAKGRIDDLLARQGDENMYELRARLRSAMDKHVGVYRTGEGLSEALATIREIRQRAENAPVTDKSRIYNSNLFHALELDNLIDLAEVTVMGALAREESRGAHSRTDFTTRDDENWLRHTLVWKTDTEPRLDDKPVTITTWKPVERKY
jgi:succinate dehydrogenase / fumarate reductase flavoprotein subunit